jgi:hypothetical protein
MLRRSLECLYIEKIEFEERYGNVDVAVVCACSARVYRV